MAGRGSSRSLRALECRQLQISVPSPARPHQARPVQWDVTLRGAGVGSSGRWAATWGLEATGPEPLPHLCPITWIPRRVACSPEQDRKSVV